MTGIQDITLTSLNITSMFISALHHLVYHVHIPLFHIYHLQVLLTGSIYAMSVSRGCFRDDENHLLCPPHHPAYQLECLILVVVHPTTGEPFSLKRSFI